MTPRVAPSDERLMAEVQAGDVDAFSDLYDRYSERAYRVARAVSRDDGGAEEAVKEAFVSIWAGRATYQPDRGTPAAWLLTLVRRRSIDLARGAAAGPPAESGVHQHLLARLPDAEHEVISLAFYGGLTHTEIAAQLDLPPGTVKGRMRLGLRHLRDGTLSSTQTRGAGKIARLR